MGILAIKGDDRPDAINNESEYKGTAIRFYSKDNAIDDIYIVSEGTQGLNDWLYNVEALVAGFK